MDTVNLHTVASDVLLLFLDASFHKILGFLAFQVSFASVILWNLASDDILDSFIVETVLRVCVLVFVGLMVRWWWWFHLVFRHVKKTLILTLGYGNQIHEGILSYEKEVLESVFDSRSSDVEDSHVNDRFAKDEGMHAVPPLMTRIYMPSKSDFGIDESKFTYGPKQSKTSKSNAKTSDTASCKSNSSVEEKPVYMHKQLDDHKKLYELRDVDSGSFHDTD
ncbi:hypothetical protein Tco_1312081 [Tanacetum coccineum]